MSSRAFSELARLNFRDGARPVLGQTQRVFHNPIRLGEVLFTEPQLRNHFRIASLLNGNDPGFVFDGNQYQFGVLRVLTEAVVASGDNGKPILVSNPTDPASIALKEFAMRVAQQVAIHANKSQPVTA